MQDLKKNLIKTIQINTAKESAFFFFFFIKIIKLFSLYSLTTTTY